MMVNLVSIFSSTKILILSVLVFHFNILLGQNPYLNWAKSFTGNGTVLSTSVTVDNQGNIINTGTFTDSIDFDSGMGVNYLKSLSEDDGYICKFDSVGNILWLGHFAGIYSNFMMTVTTDDLNYIYVAGQFQDSLDCDPTADTSWCHATGRNGIIIKLSPDGELIWKKSFGGNYYDVPTDIKVNAKHEVYICGRIQGAVYFDSLYIFNMSNNSNAFVAKMDSIGNFLWVEDMGSSGANLDQAESIVLDSLDHVYVTGNFNGTAQFGAQTLTPKGLGDIFVSKLDNLGHFIWTKQAGGTGGESASIIAFDSDWNLYVYGSYSGTMEFNTNSGVFSFPSAGGSDIYLWKMDSSGHFLWAKHEGNNYSEVCRTMTIKNDNIYLSGLFSTTVDFNFDTLINTSITSSGFNDNFIQKIDTAGNLKWIKKIGGTSAEEVRDIVVDDWENVITSGFFVATTNFDPNSYYLLSVVNGFQSGFVCKWSQSYPTNLNSIYSNASFSIYPNPNTGTFKIQSTLKEKTTIEIYNSVGQSVYSQVIDPMEDISIQTNLGTGLYFVKVNQRNFLYKFIVE